MDTSDSFVNTNKVEPYTTMGSVGIGMIRQYLRSGDIHITPINKNNGVRHGHAALAYNALYNIEIHGEGTVSSLSPNVGWGDYSAYRLYRAKVSDYSAAKVASYGRNYLLNIPYKGLASVLNNDEVNCASLVWKAFNDSGVLTLGNPGPLPYAPSFQWYHRSSRFQFLPEPSYWLVQLNHGQYC